MVFRRGPGTSCATSACELTRPEIAVYQAGRRAEGDKDESVNDVREGSFPYASHPPPASAPAAPPTKSGRTHASKQIVLRTRSMVRKRSETERSAAADDERHPASARKDPPRPRLLGEYAPYAPRARLRHASERASRSPYPRSRPLQSRADHPGNPAKLPGRGWRGQRWRRRRRQRWWRG